MAKDEDSYSVSTSIRTRTIREEQTQTLVDGSCWVWFVHRGYDEPNTERDFGVRSNESRPRAKRTAPTRIITHLKLSHLFQELLHSSTTNGTQLPGLGTIPNSPKKIPFMKLTVELRIIIAK
jgi:hypothetical protein